MTHVMVCREYPPASYPAGGIGTYAFNMARLLAEAGDTVHVIGQRWEGAPERLQISVDGRLHVHRIAIDEPLPFACADAKAEARLLQRLLNSDCPTRAFAWQVARYLEHLLNTEAVDVIEAPEWEAPLFFFQARRATGFGSRQKPPCLVHLHSPTAMIFESNEWDQTLTDFAPLCRMEESTIRAADALLCPSQYLAAQVRERFHLQSDAIEVIPYPLGEETPRLERSDGVWSRNAVCYVGRLELRKGVVEWVDAAVSVALQNASVSFDFFGADTPAGGGAGRSVEAMLRERIPAELSTRFHLHGSRSRADLMEHLRQTSLAVVPSRWENFPNTCIEAMSTGLPVIASPNGGMAEMLANGETGWIAEDGSAAALAYALRRALATGAAERAQMGARAAEQIRTLCDNSSVVTRQRQLRAALAAPAAPRVSAAGALDAVLDDRGLPALRSDAEPLRRRRYSGMALIANQSAGFALRWFLGAPPAEKLRWLRRMAAKPARVLRWMEWRSRAALRRGGADASA